MITSNSQLIEGIDYKLYELLEGKTIEFGYDFNKLIEYLPDEEIKIIVFNDKYDKDANYLPNGITHIYFGSDFNKPVNDLPNSMKFISFGVNFQQQINCLPDSIEGIRLTNHYDQEIKNLPKMLKTFNVCKIPRTITNKKYSDYYMTIIEIDTVIHESVPNYHTKYSELEEKYTNINFYY